MSRRTLVIGAALACFTAVIVTGRLTAAIALPGTSGQVRQGAPAADAAPGVGTAQAGLPAPPAEVWLPAFVNFQGRLTDPATGQPVPGGTYSVSFSIWETPVGGAPLWQETQVVEVYGGLFSAKLGSVTPFPDGLFSRTNTFLQVQVGTDPPMEPRLHFVPVPYAFVADWANWAEASHWGGLAGIPADFADNIDNDALGGLSCADGQVAKWNSGTGQWQCANDQTGGGGGSWSLTGNSGTNPSANFLGTTDNQPLVVKTNGTERARFDASGLNLPGDVRLSQAGPGHDWTVAAHVDFVSGKGGFSITDADVGLPRLSIDQNTGDVLVSKLGVGATLSSPDAALHVVSPSSYFGMLKVQNSNPGDNEATMAFVEGSDAIGGEYWLAGVGGWGNTNDFTIGRAGTKMLIQPDGKVGIGTETPSAETQLHVRTGTTDNFGVLADALTAGSQIGLHTANSKFASLVKNAFFAAGAWNRFDTSSGAFLQQVAPDGTVDLSTAAPGANPISWIRALALKTNGNVGVGTATPGAKLEVSGTSGDLLRLTNPGSPSGPTVFRVNSSGQVFADGSYNCGLSSTSACLQAGQGADIAERFDASEPVEPGDVVEVDPDHPGRFRLARSAYSFLVVGIVSSAPAVTLGNGFDAKLDQWEDNRPLLALAGRVPVKVTAENGPIQVGDLLVSSSNPGHAMRCEDPAACVGAVVGKALGTLEQGTGLVYASVLLR